jgi:hypothetical protein
MPCKPSRLLLQKMMKKYEKWDTYNVDNALDEIDQKNALEETSLNADDILKKIEREDFQATLFATRKAADAMRSKVLACIATTVTTTSRKRSTEK